MRRLLEGSAPDSGGALTAAADSGLLLAEAAGIRPDWVVGDMDSLDDENRLRFYPKDRIARHPADKDFTDTELALDLLWENGCGDLWIIGGGGGRIAHVFAVRDVFERERFPVRWITAGEDIRCVDGSAGDGTWGGFSPGPEAGDVVSVFPLGDGPWKVESRGLKWPLDGVRWKRGLYGFGNVALGRDTGIRALRGRFMIVLERVCRQQ